MRMIVGHDCDRTACVYFIKACLLRWVRLEETHTRTQDRIAVLMNGSYAALQL